MHFDRSPFTCSCKGRGAGAGGGWGAGLNDFKFIGRFPRDVPSVGKHGSERVKNGFGIINTHTKNMGKWGGVGGGGGGRRDLYS